VTECLTVSKFYVILCQTYKSLSKFVSSLAV